MSTAQDIIQGQSIVRIGDTAPDFVAASQLGEINFHNHIEGKWAVFFSHPRDYTPICTTELSRVAQLKSVWEELDVVPIALSVDKPESHEGWIKDINEWGNTEVYYPIIADFDYKVTKLYGMVNQDHIDAGGLPLTARSVFFIGPDKKVKAIITYPASTGRNFDEIVRVVKSLQLTQNHSVATPVDWCPAKRVVIPPNVTTEEAQKLFDGDVEVFKPYLRFTADPSTKEAK